MSDKCYCGHDWSEHRVSAFGRTCAVPCSGIKDYGNGMERCYCVRDLPLAEVPAEVAPFDERNVHPLRKAMSDKSAEQEARDLLERLDVEDAQAFSSGDLVELANLIADNERYRHQIAAVREQCLCFTPDPSVVDKILEIIGTT